MSADTLTPAADQWPDGADQWAAYRCWTLPADEDLAAERFTRRYGEPPAFVFVVGNLLRVGPVPERVTG